MSGIALPAAHGPAGDHPRDPALEPSPLERAVAAAAAERVGVHDPDGAEIDQVQLCAHAGLDPRRLDADDCGRTVDVERKELLEGLLKSDNEYLRAYATFRYGLAQMNREDFEECIAAFTTVLNDYGRDGWQHAHSAGRYWVMKRNLR